MPDSEPANRCLTCGYDLRGLPEPRCPECGRPFDPNEFDPDEVPWTAQTLLRSAIIFGVVVLAAPALLIALGVFTQALGPRGSGVLFAIFPGLAMLTIVVQFYGLAICAVVLYRCVKTLRRANWYGNDKTCVCWATGISATPLVLIGGSLLLVLGVAVPWFVAGFAALLVIVVFLWRILK